MDDILSVKEKEEKSGTLAANLTAREDSFLSPVTRDQKLNEKRMYQYNF